jgi:hypothetical protein
MTVQSHVVELQRKHDILDKSLLQEEMHTSRDTLKIADLKRQKLRIKEEIEQLAIN